MKVVIVTGVAGAMHVSLDINGRSHFVEVGVPATITDEVFDAINNSSIAFTDFGELTVESDPAFAVAAVGETPAPVGDETGGEPVEPAVTGDPGTADEPGEPAEPDSGEGAGSDADAMAVEAPAADAAAAPDAPAETAAPASN